MELKENRRIIIPKTKSFHISGILEETVVFTDQDINIIPCNYPVEVIINLNGYTLYQLDEEECISEDTQINRLLLSIIPRDEDETDIYFDMHDTVTDKMYRLQVFDYFKVEKLLLWQEEVR